MKNKFALCFRPVIIETEGSNPGNDLHHNRVMRHGAVSKDIIVAKVKKNNGTMQPSMSPSLLNSSTGGSIVQVPSSPGHKKYSRKTLSRVLKNILLETSPRIKVQGGKIRELTFQQKTTSDLEESNTHLEEAEDHHKRKREANIIIEENKIIPSSISSSPSSSSSRSIVSSSSDQSLIKDFKSLSMKRSLSRSRSSNSSFDKKKKAKTTKTNDKALDSSSASSSSSEDKVLVLYWMVLALLSIILWGKIFAIVLATMWLYFIPSRSGFQQIQPENNSVVKLPEIETSSTNADCSWECKKKVIMEGLLERKPLPKKALNL